MAPDKTRRFAFEAVPGIFAQSSEELDWKTWDYTHNDMGLLDVKTVPGDGLSEKPWQRLMQHIEHLQNTAAEGVLYKLIINARHGQGYHNVAENEYGTLAWDDHVAKLEKWHDAHLTDLGEQQAIAAKVFLSEQMEHKGLPAPQSFIVSPLYRCLQTAYLTWSAMRLPADRPFKPVVKEMIREVMGEHTCDRRSTLSAIRGAFPDAVIEQGFVEDDVLWRADHRETHEEHDIRTRALLDDVFENDASTVISFTSHSGSIASLLRVLGHPPFRLRTGAVIPLLIKASPLAVQVEASKVIEVEH